MFTFIVLIFLLTGLLGIALLMYVLGSKQTPKGIAFLHGPLAVIGVLLLACYAIFTQEAHAISPYLALSLFILAAIGGLVLIYRDITGKSLPKSLAIAHGAIALCGIISLFLLKAIIFFNMTYVVYSCPKRGNYTFLFIVCH